MTDNLDNSLDRFAKWKEEQKIRENTPQESFDKSPNILSKGIEQDFKWYVLHNGHGYRCGYVLIPQEHPWYKKHYDDIEAGCHGGLTFSQLTTDGWVIGFDCAHLYDLQDLDLPSTVDMSRYNTDGVVRSTRYVEDECKNLCNQAKQAINNT